MCAKNNNFAVFSYKKHSTYLKEDINTKNNTS